MGCVSPLQIPLRSLFEKETTGFLEQIEFQTNTYTKEASNGTSDGNPDLWTLDVIFRLGTARNELLRTPTAKIFKTTLELGARSALLFLQECVERSQDNGEQTAVRFIFPTRNGHVSRCDFLERRLECCEYVMKVSSFLAPLQTISSVAPRQVTASCLVDVLQSAIGGILVRDSGLGQKHALQKLDQELINRLSFPYISLHPLDRRRIAWVQGREDFKSIHRAFEAAQALGISLVILENPGHWLESSEGPYAHLREAFIAVDIEVDKDFPQRIVDAVRGYPLRIDGVMSISDVRLPGVARACEILGLPTSPYEAYAIAGDKAKTRMLELDAHESHTLSSAEDLPDYLKSVHGEKLPFPLIVKPCRGWSSDCVSRVSNEEELYKAVRKASERHKDAANPSTSVILEPYIDGPEVDANFVLLDGDILFFDINDDFPSKGDATDAGYEANFQETQNVFPTALPEDEVAALRDALHMSILRQGFSSGVFHCEARVRNSRVQYTARDGIVDLKERMERRSEDVRIYLLEINARPPGYLETVAVLLTYGVDYYALRLLLAVGAAESHRVRALAQPFVNGAQFHLSAMISPQTRTGIMKTADAAGEFLLHHPELRDQIADYHSTTKGGDRVGGPLASSLWWIAYFSVFSRASRKDCLQLVRYIEENFTYEVEED